MGLRANSPKPHISYISLLFRTGHFGFFTQRASQRRSESLSSNEGIYVHEMSIAQSLIDVLREEMISHSVKTLKSVRLNIGQMSAVVPDALSFCFEVITKDTDLEGVKLIMDIIPLVGYCNECEREFEIKEYNFVCSTCGGTKIDTIGGQGMSIVEMEVDESMNQER